ncbi:MAG: YggS family pyridoxal phosphate-dependent enzyme [Bacteroidales bacterium]|nr:YggS family pyridoxal phosphate-dependent enzyme [Bacteroidales bacterium]
MIAERLTALKNELPPEVKLVAVSKFHSEAEIMEAYGAGQRLFGENRPQELVRKASALPRDIEWHLLGHLQTNKIRQVLPWVSLLESLDSLHLAGALEQACAEADRVLSVLVEVHIGAEETKGGFSPDEALLLLRCHEDYPHLRFCGLMGMASHTDDATRIRADFELLADLHDRIRDEALQRGDEALLASFTERSMGMSDDWRIALGCGTTLVRIGTAIFGPRNY